MGVPWWTDSWNAAHAPARIWWKTDDVPHLRGKGVEVGRGISTRVLGVGEPTAPLRHATIL
jgi:hypothetical protein